MGELMHGCARELSERGWGLRFRHLTSEEEAVCVAVEAASIAEPGWVRECRDVVEKVAVVRPHPRSFEALCMVEERDVPMDDYECAMEDNLRKLKELTLGEGSEQDSPGRSGVRAGAGAAGAASAPAAPRGKEESLPRASSGEPRLGASAEKWMQRLQDGDLEGPQFLAEQYISLRGEVVAGNPRMATDHGDACLEAVGLGKVVDEKRCGHIPRRVDRELLRWVVRRGRGCCWLPESPRSTVRAFKHRFITRGSPVRMPLHRLNRPDREWISASR